MTTGAARPGPRLRRRARRGYRRLHRGITEGDHGAGHPDAALLRPQPRRTREAL
ncbi:MAG: hypothetical protein ACLVL7_04185 [Anaerotruncus massiliensis (ex Togo et al. 2019)]